MPLVTPAQLNVLRSVGNRGLDSSAIIIRPIEAENDFGTESVWATVYVDIPCWVRATAVVANIIEVASREAVIGTFRIHFEAGTDIQLGDRIMVLDEIFTIIDANFENTIQIFTTAMARKIE